MKIAHCTAWFTTETSGGTEVYVEALARELAKQGVEQVIFVPRAGPDLPDESVHEGLRVIRYDPPGFQDALDRFKPNLFHLHTWTSTAGMREFRAARRLKLPAVFTFHNFSPVCATDSLMRNGSCRCDGVIRRFACSCCYLHNRGHSLSVAWAMAAAAAAASPFFRAPDSSHRWRTLSSMFAGFERRKNELWELADEAAALVAPALFLRDVLVGNGIAGEKIVVCRQGVPGGPALARESAPGLRIGYVGRLEFLKGADLIAEAVSLLPRAKPVSLEIIGGESGVPGTRRDPGAFMAKLRGLTERDGRIHILGRLPYGQMRDRMASFDLLAVPSRTQETGPMSAMEALSLGVPVLGSDLGGIPETVRDGVDGRIVPSLEPKEWSRALEDILEDPAMLEGWKKSCRQGRTMQEVAGEMLGLYRRILAA